MTPLASITTNILTLGTLIAHISIVLGSILLVAVILKHPNARLHRISKKSADHAFLFGFLISLVSIIGSLLYSNIIGFFPCNLCWWQRIFLYPQVVLFAVALYNEKVNNIQDRMVFLYSLILSVIGGGIALFQYYGQMFNPSFLAACATQGESCAKLFFVSFGYITIPMMSLTINLLLILLYFFHRHHRAQNKA